MSSKKQPSIVNFTIHSLKLPKYVEDCFQIEYKRGNYSGMTDKRLVVKDNEVLFEASFRCPATLMKADNSSTNQYKNKKIEFTVYRHEKKRKKVFGKFTLNAADFLVARTETFELESPHTLKSYLVMTVSVTKTNTSIVANDLESQSEAIQLQTDRIEDWDVSDMLTPESQKNVQNFFMKREAEKNAQRTRLADFSRSEKQAKARSRFHHVRRNSIDLLNLQASSLSTLAEAAMHAENDLNSTISLKEQDITTSLHNLSTDTQRSISSPTIDSEKFMKRKRAPIPLPGSKKSSGDTPEKPRHHKSKRVPINDHCDDDLQEKAEPATEPKEITREAQKENQSRFLRCVLTKAWDSSPLDLALYPKAASAVVAALIESDALSKTAKIMEFDDQNDLVTQFCEQFPSSVLISNYTESIEKWFITTNIMSTIKLIQDEYNFNEILVFNLFSRLKSFIDSCFYDILHASFGPFQQIALSLLDGSFDEMKITKTLNESIKIFSDSLKIPEQLIDWFKRSMIKYFDRYLVKAVLDNPDFCSLKNAIQWNSIITVLSDQEIYQSNILLFREVASILMMPMMICATPESKNDICPDLDPKIICTILANQKVDEFLPAPNDTTMFMNYYKLVPGQFEPTFEVAELNISQDIIYSNVYKCSEWKNAKFDESLLQDFPYLHNYFI